jgi:ATP-dependent Lon protease
MSSDSIESTLPLLPLRSGVLLPHGTLTLTVGRERSLALIKSLRPGDVFALVTQRDAKTEDPAPADFHSVGVLARLVSTQKTGSGWLCLRTPARQRVVGHRW